MTTRTFVVIVLLIVLFIVVAVGASVDAITGNVAGILESPAATTNITIERLTIVTSDAEITLEGFSGEMNSKIIDLLLLSAAQ